MTSTGGDTITAYDLPEWMRSVALPLWATAGFDAQRGRFFERLEFSGKPIESAPLRAMVQARQIYVFAHAALAGWSDVGADISRRAMAGLVRDFLLDGQHPRGFAFSIDRQGTALSPVADTYAYAFILLALAWSIKLDGKTEWMPILEETNDFLDRYLKDATHGGYFDAHPTDQKNKRQNPQMHLLEAYLALDDALPNHGYLERAAALVDLCVNRLVQQPRCVLLEYFGEDWTLLGKDKKGDVFEPGHHFEWAWLLRQFERAGGKPPPDLIQNLFQVATNASCSKDGLIYDEVRSDMTPVTLSHRIWPHTEAIKAAVAHEEAGFTGSYSAAEQCSFLLHSHFLDKPFSGGWWDQIDPNGKPISQFVPASSLYHIFLSAIEQDRFRCERDRARARLSEEALR